MKKLLIVVLSIAALAAGCSRNAEKGSAVETGSDLKEYTLALSHYGSPSDVITEATELMAKRASELSNGRITIHLHPNSELGNSNAQLDGTRTGTIDIVCVGNPYYTSFAPELNLLDLPFLFESEEKAYSVLDGEIGSTLSDSLEQYNLKALAFYEIGFRDITNNQKPVKSADDLKGLKLRTTPNPAHIAAFEIWGASPTPMPFSEVYFSLKTGVIDGQENPVHHIYNNNLQEVQKYMSLTHHAFTAAPMTMNLKVFSSMDEEAQNALIQAAREGAQYEREHNAIENGIALKALIDAGMIVEENPDMDSFRNNIKGAWQGYIDSFGDELINKILAQ